MKAFLVSKPFGVVDRKASPVSSPRYYLYVGAFRFRLVTIAENLEKTAADYRFKIHENLIVNIGDVH